MKNKNNDKNESRKCPVKPFLKWAGGKRRILEALDSVFPEKIERFFDPFLGGGSVFFYIKQKYNPDYCMISDINKDLIDTYKAVRDTPEELIVELSILNKTKSSKFFYDLRDQFNENQIKGIKRFAAFIYLNKRCFNGLYRVNSKNKFNVPYGRNKRLDIYDEDNILSASALLQDVIIRRQDYKNILQYVKSGDFIYLDHCYDPLKESSFVDYTPKRFCTADREELSVFIGELDAIGGKIVLSNNDLPEIRRLYSDFDIKEIQAFRSIGSHSKRRGKVVELALSNF